MSIGMTLHAVAEFWNARLDVRDFVVGRIVSVTVVARVFGIDLHVTGRALNFAFAAVIDREGVLRQSSRQPAFNRVARGAISPE